MRSVIISCLITISLAACLNENRVEPAKPSTFVRYINGGYDDEPKALARSNDGGYLILANTKDYPNYTRDSVVKVNGVTTFVKFPMDRVKLVKVDKYGTVEWTRILPEGRGKGTVGFHANGIQVFDGGYIISGEAIKSNDKSNLVIIQTDEQGLQSRITGDTIGRHFEITLPSTQTTQVKGNVHGLAASRVSATELLVLGSISEFPGKDMVIAKVDISTGTAVVNWDWAYGSSSTKLINKLFLDQGELVFVGTTTDPNNSNLKDVRFLMAEQDASTIPAPLPFGDPALSEQANGICKTLNGYAVIGSSTVAGKTDRDILFTRFARNANGAALLGYKTYPVIYPKTETDVKLDDEGNAICETSDRGFIILGTILSSVTGEGTIGRGDHDYYLMRINTFGDVQWTKAFGSKRDDTGVDVLQAEDGGYMVLGTTLLANVPTIALIKTDASGEIN